MGCLSGCARLILVVINAIVGILWLAIAVAGGLLAWGQPLVRDIIAKYLQPFIDSLSKQSGSQVDLSKLVEMVLNLGSTVGIVLFVAGLILVIICFCGLFGACCENQCLLQTFGITLSVLIAAQIVFIIIYFVKPDLFFDPARDELTKTTIKYAGLKATNPESVIWNLIQPWQQCCGSVGAHDFDNPPSTWDHLESYTPPGASLAVVLKVAYPVTCCKMDQNLMILDTSCPATFTDVNSNVNKPCFSQMRGELTKYSNIVMYVFIGIVLGQALLVAMAFAVACAKDSKTF